MKKEPNPNVRALAGRRLAYRDLTANYAVSMRVGGRAVETARWGARVLDPYESGLAFAQRCGIWRRALSRVPLFLLRGRYST